MKRPRWRAQGAFLNAWWSDDGGRTYAPVRYGRRYGRAMHRAMHRAARRRRRVQ